MLQVYNQGFEVISSTRFGMTELHLSHRSLAMQTCRSQKTMYV